MKLQLLSLAVGLALPLAVLAGQSQDPASPAAPAATEQMQEAASAPAPTASTHVMYDAAELQWGDAPAAFEPGAQAVILSGDPSQPGLFVLRLKLPAGFTIANHWHPTDEHVTLIEGDITVRMNQDAEGAHDASFSPGAYVLLPAKMPHEATTRGGATVQVSAMGPFELIYVDPEDDPRKRPAE